MEPLDYKAIGERLKQGLVLRDKSARELAELTRTSQSTVSAWLKGKNLTFKSIENITKTLNLSVNWLILGIGEPDRSSWLQLSDKEQSLIYLGRRISKDFFDSTHALLSSLANYNKEPYRKLVGQTANKVIHQAPTAIVISLLDGTILKSNSYFDTMLGISNSEQELKALKTYDLVAHEYHSQLKQAKQNTYDTGVGNFNYFELLHYQNKTRIPVVTKSTLIDYQGTLATETIIKPVVY